MQKRVLLGLVGTAATMAGTLGGCQSTNYSEYRDTSRVQTPQNPYQFRMQELAALQSSRNLLATHGVEVLRDARLVQAYSKGGIVNTVVILYPDSGYGLGTETFDKTTNLLIQKSSQGLQGTIEETITLRDFHRTMNIDPATTQYVIAPDKGPLAGQTRESRLTVYDREILRVQREIETLRRQNNPASRGHQNQR